MISKFWSVLMDTLLDIPAHAPPDEDIVALYRRTQTTYPVERWSTAEQQQVLFIMRTLRQARVPLQGANTATLLTPTDTHPWFGVFVPTVTLLQHLRTHSELTVDNLHAVTQEHTIAWRTEDGLRQQPHHDTSRPTQLNVACTVRRGDDEWPFFLSSGELQQFLNIGRWPPETPLRDIAMSLLIARLLSQLPCLAGQPIQALQAILAREEQCWFSDKHTP